MKNRHQKTIANGITTTARLEKAEKKGERACMSLDSETNGRPTNIGEGRPFAGGLSPQWERCLLLFSFSLYRESTQATTQQVGINNNQPFLPAEKNVPGLSFLSFYSSTKEQTITQNNNNNGEKVEKNLTDFCQTRATKSCKMQRTSLSKSLRERDEPQQQP